MEPDVNAAEGGADRIFGCDVGNSRVKFGLFAVAGADSSALPACLHAAAFPLKGRIDWDRIARWFPETDICGFLAGANPAGNDRIQREWIDHTGRPPLKQVTDLGRRLKTAVDAPQRVGVDRLLNAVAAGVLRGPQQSVVIVDSGTATTIDLVDAGGMFVGGAILPGFELAATSLHAYTALLPLVTVEELAANPRRPLGTNTLAAICSGLFWGQVGAVRELTGRLSQRHPAAVADFPAVPPLVLLTGGGAALLAEQFPDARWEPHLSLQGLVLAGADLLRSISEVSGPELNQDRVSGE